MDDADGAPDLEASEQFPNVGFFKAKDGLDID